MSSKNKRGAKGVSAPALGSMGILADCGRGYEIAQQAQTLLDQFSREDVDSGRIRCLLLGARTKRPCSCAAEDTEKFPPPHGSNPRHGNAGIISSGKSLVGITTHVPFGSKAHIARLAAQRGRPMSALVQQQIKRHQAALSALPPKADKERTPRYVRFVPKADKLRRNKPASALAQRAQKITQEDC